MASTYSPSFRTELPATGDQNDAWAATVNNNWSVPLEQAISGVTTVALPDANYTLTTANASADEARMAVIVFTGALTAQRTIVAPAVPKLYIIRNQTNQRLLLATGTGTTNVTDTGTPQPRSAAPYSGDSTTALPQPGVIIPAGTTVYAYTDGAVFDYCINGLNGDVAADSIVLSSPLPMEAGGTTATTAANARTNLGLGSAAVLDASPLSNPNEVVQRDGSGNFTAGTITAGLAGTAATSTNTSLFNNQGTIAYALVGSSFTFTGSTVINAPELSTVDLWAIMGNGPCYISLVVSGSPYVQCLYLVNNGQTINPAFYTSANVQIGRYYVVPQFGTIDVAYKLFKTPT